MRHKDGGLTVGKWRSYPIVATVEDRLEIEPVRMRCPVDTSDFLEAEDSDSCSADKYSSYPVVRTQSNRAAANKRDASKP